MSKVIFVGALRSAASILFLIALSKKEAEPLIKEEQFIIKIILDSSEIRLTDLEYHARRISGTFTFYNRSEKPVEIVSDGGYWLQYVDFDFFDSDGRYIDNANY